MQRVRLGQIDRSGATDSQVPKWNQATGTWVPSDPPVTGVQGITGSGTVRVDLTDPTHPVVRGAELLMQDGVTSPPVPIETEAGDDWLYQD